MTQKRHDRLVSGDHHVRPGRGAAAGRDRAAAARRAGRVLLRAHRADVPRGAGGRTASARARTTTCCRCSQQAFAQREPLTDRDPAADRPRRSGAAIPEEDRRGYMSIVYVYPGHRQVAALPARRAAGVPPQASRGRADRRQSRSRKRCARSPAPTPPAPASSASCSSSRWSGSASARSRARASSSCRSSPAARACSGSWPRSASSSTS